MSEVAGPSRAPLRKAKTPLNVVGLLSGGKDSCYNLCHCAKLGHNIVALATLAPPEGKDELDSYMYQTVGHDAVHLIAEAMELPLYRVTITGTAVNQTSTYGSRLPDKSKASQGTTGSGHDETEDLHQLLRLVKEHHPEVNAVSVGAILSNYQRVRVEHVARRADISMVPLSFLWQRNQRALLDEMCTAGMNSVLIKVAGAGLDERDLGKSLVQMRPKLHRLHNMYEAHICGEGGEYETLTLDCPLFKKRIQLDQTTVVSHGEESSAGVYYLTVQKAHLEDKHVGDGTNLDDVTIPPELDPRGMLTLKAAKAALSGEQSSIERARDNHATLHIAQSSESRRQGKWTAIGQISAKRRDGTIQATFRQAFDELVQHLNAQQLSTAHLQHVNVYIASQDYFADLNIVYAEYFGVAPPSRACVATELSSCEADIVLDAIALDDGHRYAGTNGLPTPAKQEQRVLRRNLHVQSLSHWASANIGPYSQAVDAMGRMSIAGQIGLLPTTLELETRLAEQVALSLQHARRIFQAILESRANRSEGWIESCICWTAGFEPLVAARAAWLEQGVKSADDYESSEEEDGNDQDRWDDHWLGGSVTSRDVPFAFVVLANDGLPRGAAVEWQLTAHSGEALRDEESQSAAKSDDDDDDQEGKLRPTFDKAGTANHTHLTTTSRKGGSSAGIVILRNEGLVSLHGIQAHALNARIFYTSAADVSTLSSQVASSLPDAALTFVPVSACFDLDLQPATAVIVWQGIGL